MLGRQRRAVHRVGEEDILGHRLLERQAALVVLLLPSLQPAVETPEENLGGALVDPGLLEQAAQRHPGPLGVAHRLQQPRLAQGPRREPGAAVPRALHRHLEALRGAGTDLLEGERQLPVHPAADPQTPGPGVDHRDVVVDEEVVEPDRGDVVGRAPPAAARGCGSPGAARPGRSAPTPRRRAARSEYQSVRLPSGDHRRWARRSASDRVAASESSTVRSQGPATRSAHHSPRRQRSAPISPAYSSAVPSSVR